MWCVALFFIAVANCNGELCRPQTDDLPVTASGDHRIIGGSDTTIEKYPYVVQIRVTIKKKILFQCGGSLVTDSHVLTAAHCFFYGDVSYERRPNRFTIREGTTYRGKGGKVHRITAIKLHEYYDTEIFNFDLAVALMSTPVDYSVSVARANIIPKMYPVVPDNAEVTAVGWGYTSVDDSKIWLADVLQEVKLLTIRLFICKERYRKLRKEQRTNYTVTNYMMCAGILDVGGKDACSGDSGGPLIYNGLIVGITSWGHSCADPQAPGVYADVTKLTNWIRKTCNELSLKWHGPDTKQVSKNGSNPDDTNPGSIGSLSSKIGFATLVAPILYIMLSV